MNESDFDERLKNMGRNDPCPCGSGRKYKKCHLPKDEHAQQEEIKKQQQAAPVADNKERGSGKDKSAAPRFDDHGAPKLKGSKNVPHFKAPRRTP